VVEQAELFDQHGPVDARQPVVAGMARIRARSERALDRPPGVDERRQVLRHDPQPERRRRRERVDRAAEGEVDRHPARLDPARDDVRRHVAEGHRLHRPAAAAHRRHHAAGRHVDRHLHDAVVRRRDPAALDRPRAERDGPVPARRRVAVLVPEEDAEVGAAVVGRHEEAAVHVGVSARLVAEHAPDDLGRLRRHGRLAPGRHRRPGQLRRPARDDPERLARRVVVRRDDLHGRAECRRLYGPRP
jgi:hypothetical protein